MCAMEAFMLLEKGKAPDAGAQGVIINFELSEIATNV